MMRRILKVMVWLVGCLVVLAAVAYIGVVITSNRMMAAEVEVPVVVADIHIPEGDPLAIERGNYLMDHVLGCRVCHAQDLGGRAEVDDPLIGTLWGPNLTSGQGSVTRTFTSGDWVRAIRHGVGPDKRRLILMPSEDFQSFSDDDLGAIVAAIKAAAPVDREDRGIKVGPLGRVLLATGEVRFAYDVIEHARARPPVPMGATAEWGRVMAGACIGCHGPAYSGGQIPGGDPSWPPAANLTPDASGIESWTLADFTRALREGKRPDGSEVRPPMPWQAYAGMTDEDIQALYLFFRTLPPKAAGGR